jgi:hypothetical protein
MYGGGIESVEMDALMKSWLHISGVLWDKSIRGQYEAYCWVGTSVVESPYFRKELSLKGAEEYLPERRTYMVDTLLLSNLSLLK